MAYEKALDKISGFFGNGSERKKAVGKRQEEAKANEVMSDFTRAKTVKQEIVSKWINYIKLYRGDHWGNNRARWKTQSVHNIAYQIVEQQIPLMGDRQPEMKFYPQTLDDQKHSKVLNQASGHVWEKDYMDEKMPVTLRDTLTLGTGIMKMNWDSERYNGMGEINAQITDPFHFYPAPGSTDPYTDMPWCIVKTKMDLEEIEFVYGKKVPSDADYHDQDQQRPTDVNNGNTTQFSTTAATVLERWKFDRKRRIWTVCTVSNGVYLEEKDSPYEHDMHPFIFFYNVKLNGEFWGISEFESIKTLQMELNKSRSMIMDNMIATNNTIITVDSNSGVRTTDISNKPGLVIEKQPGARIERLAPPHLPNHFFTNVEMTKQAIEEVSGVREISRGVTSQTAASGIQMLIEESQTRVRGKLRNVENGIKRMGYWYLVFFRQMYNEPRLLRITDADGFKFETFDGRELRQSQPVIDPNTGQPAPVLDEQGQPVINPETGEPEVQMEELLSEFDVQVATGSTMLVNKSAKFQQNFELWKVGALDTLTLLESSDAGDVKEITQRLIAEGKMADPNAPKVDMSKLLADLGVKINANIQNPELVKQFLDQMQQQVQEMEGQTGELQGDLGDKINAIEKTTNDVIRQQNQQVLMPQPEMNPEQPPII